MSRPSRSCRATRLRGHGISKDAHDWWSSLDLPVVRRDSSNFGARRIELDGIQEVDGSIPFGSTTQNKRLTIDTNGPMRSLEAVMTPF